MKRRLLWPLWWAASVFFALVPNTVEAQCSNPGQFPSTINTLDQTTTTPVIIAPNSYTTEYSVVQVNFPGVYTFEVTRNSSGTPGYVTLTDDLNNVIAHGPSPFHAPIPGTGQYRAHWTDNAACGNTSDNHTTTAVFTSSFGCMPPQGITATGITATSANISWTASTSNPANGYEYVVTTTAGTPTGSGTPTTATSLTITTLAPNTQYFVYVRALCVNDSSPWNFTSFLTACGIVTAPWTEDFEGPTFVAGSHPFVIPIFDPCWTVIPASGAGYSWWVETDNTSSSGTGPSADHTTGVPGTGKYIYTEASSGSTDDEAEVYTPLIDISGIINPALRFRRHFYGADIDAFFVEVDAGSGFQTVYQTQGDGPQTDETDPWVEEEVDLNAFAGSTALQIRFRAISAGCCAGDMALDDISVDVGPPCPKPTTLSVVSTGVTDVTLDWVPNSVTSWEVAYGAPGFDPEAAVGSPNGPIGIVPAGTHPFTVTGLTADTEYHFYVREACALWFPGGNSEWRGFAGTRTNCPPAVTAPWSDSFEAGLSPCWIQSNTDQLDWEQNSGGTDSPNTGPSAANDGSQYIYVETNGSSAGDKALIQSPPVDITTITNPVLIFDYHMYGAGMGWFHVMVDSANTGNIDTLFAIYGDRGDQWNSVMLSLADYEDPATGTVSVQFELTVDAQNGSAFENDLALDHVRIEQGPACLGPAFLTAMTDGSSAVSVSFNPLDPAATGWEMEYGPKGYTSGSGTVLSLTSPNATITGLSPGTCYDFHVREACSSSPGSFTPWSVYATACTFVVPPYFEPFTVTYDDAEWDEASGLIGEPTAFSGSSSNWTDDGFGNVGFDGSAKLNIWTTTTDEWTFTPVIELGSSAQWQLEFDWTCRGYNSTSASTWGPDDTVYVVISTDAGATWNRSNALLMLDSTAIDNAGTNVIHEVIDISMYAGNNIQIGFYGESTISNEDTDFFIDNVRIDGPNNPLCPVVTAPWTEDFEGPTFVAGSHSAVLPTFDPCWTVIPVSGAGYSWWVETDNTASFITGNSTGPSADHTTGVPGSGQYIYTEASSGSTGHQAEILTPLIDISGITNPALRFWRHFYGANIDEFFVEVDAGGGFQTIYQTQGPGPQTDETDPWVEEVLDLNAFAGSTALQIRFRAIRGGGLVGDMALDDISVDEGPPCFGLPSLTVAANSSSAAGVSFNPVDPAAMGWEIEYGPQGYTAGNGTVISVTSSTPTITGLSPGTCYDFHVREACTSSPGSFSSWSAPATACTFLVPPYFEPFTVTYHDAEWDERTGLIGEPTVFSGSSSGWTNDGFGNVGFDGSAKLNIWSIFIDEWTFTPVIELNSFAQWQLEFDWTCREYAETSAGSWGADDTVYVVISTDAGATWNRSNALLMLDSTAIANAGTDTIHEVIDISMYAGNNIRIGFYGESTVYNEDTDFFIDNVRIDGPGTLCAAVTAPWAEDFEGPTFAPGITFDPCWTTIPVSGAFSIYSWWVETSNTSSVNTGPSADHTTGVPGTGRYIYTEASWGSTGDQAEVRTPLIDISAINNPVLRFWKHFHGADIDSFFVDVNTGSGFQTIYAIQGDGPQTTETDPWVEEVLDLNAFAGSTVLQIRFRAISAGCCAGDMALDDISIDIGPPCFKPSAISVVSVGTTDVTLDWVPSSGTSWEVAYGAPGFHPDAAVGSVNGPIGILPASTHPFLVSGLTAQTEYHFYVREACAMVPGVSSEWRGFASALTNCALAVTAPWTEDFEGPTFSLNNTFDPCWTTIPASGSGYSWWLETHSTTSSNTGPSADQTTGVPGTGQYIYTEASYGSIGDQAAIWTPWINISGITNPALRFWKHFHGTDIGSFLVEVDTGSGFQTIYQTYGPGPQTASTDPWVEEVLDLNPFAGSTTLQIRFRAISGGDHGDMALDDISVDVGPPCFKPSPIAAVTDITCYGASDGSIAITLSGGYTLVWDNGLSAGTSHSNLSAGTYRVSISDANGYGCEEIFSYTLTEPDLLAVTTNSVTQVSCFGGHDGALNVTVSGGTPPYSYLWNTGDITSALSNLMAGPYQVTITDAMGCTQSSAVTNITQPSAIVATGGTMDISCHGANDGSIDVSVSGGTPNYTYAWSRDPQAGFTDPGTEDLSGLEPGTYTLTVSDDHDCSATLMFSLTEPEALTVSVGSSADVSCFGGNDGALTVSISGGSPPYSYLWNTGDATSGLSNLTAGPYQVTVTDAVGCTQSLSVSIAQPSALVATGGATDISCYGASDGSIDVSVSGGIPNYAYSWSRDPQAGFTDPGTEDLSGLEPGTYTLTVTDDNGCPATLMFTITEPDSLTVSAGSLTNVSCFGGNDGALSVSVSGGTSPYSYLWNTGDVTPGLSNRMAGIYQVTVTDAAGCTQSSALNITQPGAALAATGGATDISCHGASNGSIDVTVSGGTTPYTYAWSRDPETGFTDPGTEDLLGLEPGMYTLTVTDDNGCPATLMFALTEPDDLTVSTGSLTDVSCFGGNDGALSVSVSGGTSPYSYLWNTGDATSGLSNLTAGTYHVSVTDNNGCEAFLSYTLTEPDALTASAGSVTNVSCFGGNDGALSVSVSGGTSPYSYLWNTGDVTPGLSNLTAGTYHVSVTDNNGCEAFLSYTITEPDALTASAGSSTVSCFGGNDGALSVSVSGGTSPYSYLWNTGDITPALSNLMAGAWQVTVTDANGCTVDISATVAQNTAISTNIVQSNVDCFGGSNGSISLNVNGGTPPYSYLWNTGHTISALTNLTAGTYEITLTDASGCAIDNQVVITEPAELVITVNNVAPDELMASVTGGSPPYTYLWSTNPPQITPTATGLSPGTYTVTVTDANGCSDIAQGNIISMEELNFARHISLYPNPTAEEVFIDYDFTGEVDLEVTVVNHVGQVVLTISEPNAISGKLRLDATDWANGVYNVLFSNGSQSSSRQLVIQK